MESNIRIINDSFPLQKVSGVQLDVLMENGFQFLGETFFRYSHFGLLGQKNYALRIRLDGFAFSKSQRKILRSNQDLHLTEGAYVRSPKKTELFKAHFDTLKTGYEHTIEVYIADDCATIPTPSVERCLYLGEELIAYSICHIGEQTATCTYGVYDPAYRKRNLGWYTLLLEIQASIDAGHQYFYLGFAWKNPPSNHYKLNFNNLESFDWQRFEWHPIERKRVGEWV